MVNIKDPRIDSYIANVKPFAQPILHHLRELIHQACPDVKETIKWSVPAFDYKGPLCGFAAFKEHCIFGFWKEKLMKDPHGIFVVKNTMGHFGRITSLADLPSDEILIAYIKEAMLLNEQGIKLPKKVNEKKELVIPDFFMDALHKNKEALATFQAFSYSKQKEYIEWIVEAKQEGTRQTRLATALQWISEGKSRHWKYEKEKDQLKSP